MNILIIDDEADIREILAEQLVAVGHTVTEAGNGDEGLQALEGQELSLVVCDVDMPKVDGLHFLENARATHPDLLIYIFSSSLRANSKELLEKGATKVFDKFQIQEILTAIAHFSMAG